MISLKRLEELSSVKERTIRHFFNEKQNDEFLYDSITDSIVYY